MSRMEIFSEQIEKDSRTNQNIIIMGDANLCSSKRNNSDFKYKNLVGLLKDTLEQCGLLINDIGWTYQADHAQANVEVAESSLDHTYHSRVLEDRIRVSKLENSSSDHLPIVATMKLARKKMIYMRKIRKRSLKPFTKEF